MNPIVRVLRDMVYIGFEKFGRYYSSYRGFVQDNNDPKGYGRVTLVVPGIIDNPNEYWAWQKSRYAGPGYGVQCIPEVGDVVWVEFEQGDPNKPIWSHGHFAMPDLDGLPEELKEIKAYYFRTPLGHTVCLNDKDKTIKVTHGESEIQLVINSTGLSVVLPDKTQMFLGSLDKGKEPVTKADSAANILTSQLDVMSKSLDSMSSMGTAMTTFANTLALAATPAALVTSVSTNVPTLVKGLKDSADLNKGLNESINSIKNAIPGIKSDKVKTD